MEGEMGEVGKPGLSGANVPRHFDSLGYGEVRGMRFVAETVNDEDGNIVKLLSNRGGNGGAVGKVGGARTAVPIQAKPGRGDAAVGNRERDKGDGAELEGSLDAVGLRTNVGGTAVIHIESVIKGLVQAGKGVGIGVNRNPVSVFDGVGAQVVEAGDVIGMAVRVDGGIQPGNARTESLGTKVRGGIDDHAEIVILQPGGGPIPAIPRVPGGADTARAGEEGDPLGRAGAEQGEAHGRLG